MASATVATMKGFGLCCPACGEEAVLTLDLNDFEDCRCAECDWSGTPREALEMVQEQARKWAAVVGWLAMAKDALATIR